jgi:cytochrome c oxidase subunit III
MASSITFDRGGSGGAYVAPSPDYRGRLRRARLGLAVALTPIIMLFVSFTSAYVVRQGLPTLDDSTGTYVSDWFSVNLPLAILAINTLVLLISSITMELARRRSASRAVLNPIGSIPGISIGKERGFPWLALTVALGMMFLAGQWLAWRQLAAHGFYVASTPSSSFVYLLTGAHAVHLAGGVLALLYASTVALVRKSPESRFIVVDTAAWYWHFMALLWIYIFALLEFAK